MGCATSKKLQRHRVATASSTYGSHSKRFEITRSSNQVLTLITVLTLISNRYQMVAAKRKSRNKTKRNSILGSSSVSSRHNSLNSPKSRRTPRELLPTPVTLGDYSDLSLGSMEAMNLEMERLPREALRAFIMNVTQIGVTGLLDEFKEIKKVKECKESSVYEVNTNKNRYKAIADVFCIEETRVLLRDGGEDYIHANWVTTPLGVKYILTQGPLQSTCEDFWRMVWQERCPAILMLCNVIENGRRKCEQYYPECAGQTEIHYVEHIHWVDWPDLSVPDDTFVWMKLVPSLRKRTPTIVHCSAGIGRSGTIVGLDILCCRIGNAELVTLKQVVMDLRKMRDGAVQVDAQYIYMARCMVELALRQNAVTVLEMAPFVKACEEFCGKHTCTMD